MSGGGSAAAGAATAALSALPQQVWDEIDRRDQAVHTQLSGCVCVGRYET